MNPILISTSLTNVMTGLTSAMPDNTQAIMFFNADGSPMEKSKAEQLIELYNQGARITTGLRRGGGFEPEEYFTAITPEGVCPPAHLTVRQAAGLSRRCFVYSEEELNTLVAQAERELDETLPPLPQEPTEADIEMRRQEIKRRIDITHIFEAAECAKFTQDLAAFGLKPANLYSEGDEALPAVRHNPDTCG